MTIASALFTLFVRPAVAFSIPQIPAAHYALVESENIGIQQAMASITEPDEKHPQNLCLDAGYTSSGDAVERRNYLPHIRSRGEEKKEWDCNPDFHARRWVVKVTRSFFNRFRKFLVRYGKKDVWR